MNHGCTPVILKWSNHLFCLKNFITRLKKACTKSANYSKDKVIFSFLTIRWTSSKRICSLGITIIKEFYVEFLKCLCIAIRYWKSNEEWMFHCDNTKLHNSIIVKSFLAKYVILIILHPLYSPDLLLSDFLLFNRMKMFCKFNKSWTSCKQGNKKHWYKLL